MCVRLQEGGSVPKALLDIGDVPLSLGFHLPDAGAGAGAKAVGGEDLRGAVEAGGNAGVSHPGSNVLRCTEVIGDWDVIIGAVRVRR